MIAKCFKCDGSGIEHQFDYEGFNFQPGYIPKMRPFTCSRCLGTGALDYRVVEAKPVTQSPSSNPPGETI